MNRWDKMTVNKRMFLLLGFHSKPQQSVNSNNASASRGFNDVDSVIKTSNLSASAPEFVPTGYNPYEVRRLYTIVASALILLLLYSNWCICLLLSGSLPESHVMLDFLFSNYRNLLIMMMEKITTANQHWLIWSQTSWPTLAPRQGPSSQTWNT